MEVGDPVGVARANWSLCRADDRDGRPAGLRRATFVELLHRFHDLPTRPTRAWRASASRGTRSAQGTSERHRDGVCEECSADRPLHDVASQTIGRCRSRGQFCSSLATRRAPRPSSLLFEHSAIGTAFALPSPSNGFSESVTSMSGLRPAWDRIVRPGRDAAGTSHDARRGLRVPTASGWTRSGSNQPRSECPEKDPQNE